MRDLLELPPYGRSVLAWVITALSAFFVGAGVTFAVIKWPAWQSRADDKMSLGANDEESRTPHVWDVSEFDERE